MRVPFMIGVLCACLSHGGESVAAEIKWEKTAEGETAFVPMKAAPYPHPSRAEGHTYNKLHYAADKHYTDNTVGLFVPRGLSRTPKVNLLVYLHGWSNNVRKAIPEYKLREVFRKYSRRH